MFVKRDISKTILKGAQQVPVLAIIGPRQSGKSTLAQHLFPNHTYLDLQDADNLDFATQDPKGFLNTHANKHGIILDEAQYAPALFSQIKVAADKNPQAGYYILSGSQNFLLHEKISESLAGRAYFYTLLPFSINELSHANLRESSVHQQVLKGFYPRVYQPTIDLKQYYENYISTYVERDIRTIKNIDNILAFKKFMQLCALRVGSTLNYADLATSCGISVATAKSWLALLEASFIIFLLPSYHTNLGKRLIKSPKLFFYDSGIAASFMGADYEILIKKRELFGALFENMVISDLIKNLNTHAIRYQASFWRDSNQNEIDIIIEAAGKTLPIEIKSSTTMQAQFFDMPYWFAQQIQSDAHPYVIYGGEEEQKRTKGTALAWHKIAKLTALL